ncbi:MAG: hypothetical protein M1827_004242 [Pycnora praestabilis]|nr:MAG: hypothetical protein M1827_004242 [Pycnora praestabilis]
MASTDPEKDMVETSTPSSQSHHSLAETASVTFRDYHLVYPEEVISREVSHVPVRPQLSRKTTSIGTTGTTDPDYEVIWDGDDDKTNPKNWPLWYRGVTLGFVSFATWVVVLYSTSYTSGMPGMMKTFHVSSEPIVTLGITTYLIGLAIGAVVLAPLSEIYGRRPVYLGSMLIFMLLVIPCAMATSLEEILVVRFFGALAGSAMIANAPGTVTDIVDDEHRALAFSIWSIGPLNGPVFGPLIGGFAYEYLGWRWTNWLVVIFGGAAWVMVCLVKETYAPAILQQKAKQKRKEMVDPRWWSPYDNKLKLWDLLKVNLSRPFVLIVTEPICMFWDLYVAVIYGILYLCFVAYPIVFSQIRGWSPGLSGLAFVGIGIGTFIAIAMEPLLRRMINSHKIDPETGKVPPEAAVSVICIAAVCAPVGQLWFSWTCVPVTIHWVWPILAGIPFGWGNTACFIYASNYLAGSYGIYAASALAGNTVIRSVIGGTLPLAGPAMYSTLDPNWAGTVLGLLEVLLIPIPFVFYKYGQRIRMTSTLIQSMQRDKARFDGKRAKQALKAERKKWEEGGDKGRVGEGDEVEETVEKVLPVGERNAR